MEIEELNKSQIVLLTLLVSFVTSIATGIVTVSLMQQAPPAIAQTVNRVIERTVEKMVPQSQGAAAASVVTQEKTIVVKESDLIPQAVAKATPSVTRLYASTKDDAAFLGFAVVIGSDGMLVTDIDALGTEGSVAVAARDGTRVVAFVTARDEVTGIGFLRAATSTDAGPLVWKPADIGGAPQVGTTILSLGGVAKMRIASGLVTANDTTSFDTDHSEGNSGNQDNSPTAASGYVIASAANALTVLKLVSSAMAQFKDDQGKHYGARPTAVMVPTGLEWVMKEAFDPMFRGGGETSATNWAKGAVQVIVNPFLANAGTVSQSYVYWLDLSKPIKPFIFQNRKAPEFVALDKPDSYENFMRKRIIYGVDARFNMGFGDWKLAYRTKGA